MGTVYLLVPKVRKGGYVPFFISERRRSEQARIAVVQDAFINGVSVAVMIACGVNPAGSREILAGEPMFDPGRAARSTSYGTSWPRSLMGKKADSRLI